MAKFEYSTHKKRRNQKYELVPENWIEVSVLEELRNVRIMTQGDLNLRPLWRDQQP